MRSLLLGLVTEEGCGWLLVVVPACGAVGHIVEGSTGVEVRARAFFDTHADGVGLTP